MDTLLSIKRFVHLKIVFSIQAMVSAGQHARRFFAFIAIGLDIALYKDTKRNKQANGEKQSGSVLFEQHTSEYVRVNVNGFCPLARLEEETRKTAADIEYRKKALRRNLPQRL